MSRWLTSLAVVPLLLTAGCGKEETAAPAAPPGSDMAAATPTSGMPETNPVVAPGVMAPETPMPGAELASATPMPATPLEAPGAVTLPTDPTLSGPGNTPLAPPVAVTPPTDPTLSGPGNTPLAPPGILAPPTDPTLSGPGNTPLAPATPMPALPAPGTEATPAAPLPGVPTTPGDGNPNGNAPKFEEGTPEAVVYKLVLQTAAGKQDGLEDGISEQATGRMAKLRKQELTEEEVKELQDQTEKVILLGVSEGSSEKVVKLLNDQNKMLEFRMVREKEVWRVKNLYVKVAPRVAPNQRTNR